MVRAIDIYVLVFITRITANSLTQKGSFTENWFPHVVCVDKSQNMVGIYPLLFLKTLGHNIKAMEKTLDAKEVMFCHDSRSILDKKYPALVVETTGVTGFGHIKPDNIEKVLNMTYWYRKYSKQYNIPKNFMGCYNYKRFSSNVTMSKAGIAYS